MLSWIIYAKFWHLNITPHQIGVPVWIITSVSHSYLTWVALSGVFCCCSPFASRLRDALLQTLVVTWLSEYLLHPLSSKQSGYFLLFTSFSVNQRDGCAGKITTFHLKVTLGNSCYDKCLLFHFSSLFQSKLSYLILQWIRMHLTNQNSFQQSSGLHFTHAQSKIAVVHNPMWAVTGVLFTVCGSGGHRNNL